MGQGNSKLDTSFEIKVEQDLRDALETIVRIEREFVDLYCQLRKLSLVIGSADYVQQFGNRREQSLQRSLYKTVQILEEILKDIQKTINIDGNPLTPEHSGSVGPSGDIGYGTTVRNFINEVQRQVPDAGQNQPAH